MSSGDAWQGPPESWVFDGHNDLPWAWRELHGVTDGDGAIRDLADIAFVHGEPRLNTDLPRLRAGGVGAQFWSVYVPGTLSGGEAVAATLEQIEFVHRFVAAHPAQLGLAHTADEVRDVVASGRIASVLGAEGGHSIGSSLAVLASLHRLGVRYLTLTHNQNLPWADSATDEPVLGGLSEFGRDVVRECNRLGMFVDLSHVSAAVMRDALQVSSHPVIFSHSSAFARCDFARNVPDEVLTALAANGGVCCVTFPAMFVSQDAQDWYRETQGRVRDTGGDPRDLGQVLPAMERRARTDPPPVATVADVADHVEHIRDVAGLDHVGIGGDYDGSSWWPEGMGDVGGYAALWDALRSRRWSEAELAKLGHENLLRAMGDLA